MGREELAAMLALQLGKRPSDTQINTTFNYLTHQSQRISFEAYMAWVWDGSILPNNPDKKIHAVSANELPEALSATTIYLRRPRLIPLGNHLCKYHSPTAAGPGSLQRLCLSTFPCPY